jgi:hypothetical protein
MLGRPEGWGGGHFALISSSSSSSSSSSNCPFFEDLPSLGFGKAGEDEDEDDSMAAWLKHERRFPPKTSCRVGDLLGSRLFLPD